jgi:hypothetical protein
MTNPMQPDPGHLRVALDNGEVVELDGGTLMLGEEARCQLVDNTKRMASAALGPCCQGRRAGPQGWPSPGVPVAR